MRTQKSSMLRFAQTQMLVDKALWACGTRGIPRPYWLISATGTMQRLQWYTLRSSKVQFRSSVTKESPCQRDIRSSYPHHASPKKWDGKLLMEWKMRVNPLRRWSCRARQSNSLPQPCHVSPQSHELLGLAPLGCRKAGQVYTRLANHMNITEMRRERER